MDILGLNDKKTLVSQKNAIEDLNDNHFSKFIYNDNCLRHQNTVQRFKTNSGKANPNLYLFNNHFGTFKKK